MLQTILEKPTTNFIPVSRQSINDEDNKAVLNALKQDVITRGSYVEKFENDVASYCKAKFAVCFNNGTSALQATYFAAGVQPKQKVITSPNTFVGTFVGAMNYKAQVIFGDIDLSSGNLDIFNNDFSNADLIVPVHFSGIPLDIEKLRKMAPNIIIVEDAAHALGATYQAGEHVGSCYASDMTVFSFHPAKSITTGEGGMVTTNCPNYYQRLKLFRNNGIVRDLKTSPYPGFYRVDESTGNYNITDFQAALGSSQMMRLNSFINKRRQLVSIYRELLGGKEEITFFAKEYDKNSSHHLFVVMIDFERLKITRRQLMERLREKNIGTQVHYIPAYRHPICEGKGHLSNMETYYKRAVTLPLYYDMESNTVEYVSEQILKVLYE